MHPAPTLPDDDARLTVLHDLQLLDTPPEPRFGELVELAAFIAHTPIAATTSVPTS